jgi:serine/threonine protein kinase
MTGFSQVRDLFDRVMDLPLEQRAGFLADACGSDQLLRDELQRIVEAYERLDTHFATETATSAHVQSGTADDDSLSAVGPYRIIREIAQGGMGAVYLGARDDDEYKKRVAVKLLRRGVTSEAVVRRRPRPWRSRSVSDWAAAH